MLLLLILAGAQIVTGQGELLAAAHRGRERMRGPVLAGLCCRVGLVLSGGLGMILGASVLWLAALVAFWALPLLLLALGLPRGAARELNSKAQGDPTPLGGSTSVSIKSPGPDGARPFERPLALLRRAAPIGLGAVLWTIYFRIDVVLLAFQRGEVEAGIFSAPYRLVEAALLVAGPLTAAAFPVWSRLKPGDSEFRLVFGGVVRALGFLGAPVAVFLAIESGPILSALFGPDFSESASPLTLLAPIVLLSFIASPFLAALLGRNRERSYAAIMAAGVAVNLIAAFLLIPSFGARGAAVATLTTEAAVLLLALLATDLRSEVPRALSIHARALVAAGLAGGLTALLAALGLPLGLRAPLAFLLAYPALAFSLRVFTPARFLLLYQSLLRRE